MDFQCYILLVNDIQRIRTPFIYCRSCEHSYKMFIRFVTWFYDLK